MHMKHTSEKAYCITYNCYTETITGTYMAYRPDNTKYPTKY